MKKILLTLTVALTVGFAHAQCTAGFTWSQSQPNLIDFVNTSSPPNPGDMYVWYWGDTLADVGPGPFQHLYYVPGVYYACLYVTDSIGQLQCSYCDSVTVTGTVLCNMLVSSVGGVASYPTAADGGAGVTNIVGGTPPYTFLWSTGATTQSINGLLPGTYWCCVSDAGGCTTCDTVMVTSNNSTSCQVGSYITFAAPGWINAQGNAWGVSNSYSLSWDFGDLTTATGPSVWHQYAQSGTYAVCVTVTDALTGCTSTSCDSVNIVISPQLCNAAFSVQPDTANPNQAWIYNLSTGSPTMTYQWSWGDQTPVDTGAYPTHVYQNTGTYWILLVVIDTANNCYDSSSYQPLWVPRLTQQASLAPYYVNVVPPIPTGIIQASSPADWTLFPNPSDDVLNISNVKSSDEYIITDLAGRTVLSGTMLSNSVSIAALNSGTYIFTLVKENGETESKRFIRN